AAAPGGLALPPGAAARSRLPAGVEVRAGARGEAAEVGAVGGDRVDEAGPVPVGDEGQAEAVGGPHRRRLLAAVGGHGVVVAPVGVDHVDVPVGGALAY